MTFGNLCIDDLQPRNTGRFNPLWNVTASPLATSIRRSTQPMHTLCVEPPVGLRR